MGRLCKVGFILPVNHVNVLPGRVNGVYYAPKNNKNRHMPAMATQTACMTNQGLTEPCPQAANRHEN